MTESMFSAKTVKSLIADNQLDDAITQLLQHTEHLGDAALHNQVVVQSGKYRQYQRERNLGTADYADLARSRVMISLALLDILQMLPVNEGATKPRKLPGVSEQRFKKQVMYLLSGGKLFLFLFVFTLWEAGAMTFDGMIGTLGITFPVFASYLALAYDDMLLQRHRHDAGRGGLRVNRSVQYSAFFFFFLYYLALFLVLYYQGQGSIPDEAMQGELSEARPSYKNLFALLALVETFIGVYVGKLVFSLFKKEA